MWRKAVFFKNCFTVSIFDSHLDSFNKCTVSPYSFSATCLAAKSNSQAHASWAYKNFLRRDHFLATVNKPMEIRNTCWSLVYMKSFKKLNHNDSRNHCPQLSLKNSSELMDFILSSYVTKLLYQIRMTKSDGLQILSRIWLKSLFGNAKNTLFHEKGQSF